MKVTIITSAPWKSEVRGVCALNVTLVSVDQEINTTGFCLVMHAWITIYYRRNRGKISSGFKYRNKSGEPLYFDLVKQFCFILNNAQRYFVKNSLTSKFIDT